LLRHSFVIPKAYRRSGGLESFLLEAAARGGALFFSRVCVSRPLPSACLREGCARGPERDHPTYNRDPRFTSATAAVAHPSGGTAPLPRARGAAQLFRAWCALLLEVAGYPCVKDSALRFRFTRCSSRGRFPLIRCRSCLLLQRSALCLGMWVSQGIPGGTHRML